MLTATYNTPASEWTRAIDAALAAWSAVVDGDARFNIEIAFDSGMAFLAMARVPSHVPLGYTGGRPIYLAAGIARFQGRSHSAVDFRITVNPTYPWSFSTGVVSGRHDAVGVMIHELGHAFGFHERNGNMVTPFMLAREQEPARFTGTHFVPQPGPRRLMLASIDPGMHQHITEHDKDVAAACGVPIKGRLSTIHLVPNGAPTCVSVGHTAVWWGRLAEFDADLSRCATLELRGDNALTEADANLYRLYRAAFGRVPDLTGFRFWRSHSSTFDAKVEAFSHSPEFQEVFAETDGEGYLLGLYRNVLGRDPDPSGFAYWLGRTDLSRQDLLAHFALSAENRLGVPSFTL